MVTPVLAEQREELVQKERRGDDRRSGIEVKTIMTNDAATAAELIETIDEGHMVAKRAGAQARRDAAEAAADDDDAASHRRFRLWSSH
jgi:hypothetical protein